MTAARPTVLSCPRCGGRLPGVSSSALLDCPSCGSPLSVLVDEAPVREAVRPRLGKEEAIAATRAFWEGKRVPRAFFAEGSVVEPVLVFVPFHERVRTLVLSAPEGPTFVDRASFAPAVKIPGVPLERLDAAAAVLGRGERPEQLPETGPRELAALARRINALGREVHDLLEGRTTLLAGLSHDLRTPLARMRLALEMLGRRPDPAFIERLDRDIEEMNRLVGDMLELARGLGREAPREVDVQALLEQLATQAREAGVDVTVSAAQCTVSAAPQALRRLLGNLLSNAQRYGGGRPVELVARRESDGVRIGVLDRGPGIPPDQVEAVFRPFHRVEASRSPGTGGAGLGLAIVRQLAQANGWSVELENRAEGGLAAWVVMPDPGSAS